MTDGPLMTVPQRSRAELQAERLIEGFGLCEQTLGALPIVAHFMRRLRLAAVLERWLPRADTRTAVPAVRVLMVLIMNLCVAREPLYGLGDWAARHDPWCLGLGEADSVPLSDDRAGRALDVLFDADRGSLLTELMLIAIDEFDVDCSQLHNDSTSVTLFGEYRQADGRARGGQSTAAAARGHSKDHRPDLKQLVSILTVTADGALPIAYRLADGNTTDDQTHIDTWDGLVALIGSPGFLYVADSKLCTREQMTHIHEHQGRFVTILPRSRGEDRRLREWTATNTPRWVEAKRTRGKRKRDPDQVWRVCPAPFSSQEGFHIAWVHSSTKERLDRAARTDRIDRARRQLEELAARLSGPYNRLHTREQVEGAARKIISTHRVSRWITATVTETSEQHQKQQTRGRPGKNTRYRTVTTTRHQLHVTVNNQTIAHDSASDGCFPLITNDPTIPDPEILAAYHYQPNLEKRHHQLKSIQHAAPVTLKSPFRIEALFCCQYIAQLINCLTERQLRRAMRHHETRQLPLYHEQRACTAPTATRIYEQFATLQRHHLTNDGHHLKTFNPQLTNLQQQLLNLLNIPTNTYTHHTRPT